MQLAGGSGVEDTKGKEAAASFCLGMVAKGLDPARCKVPPGLLELWLVKGCVALVSAGGEGQLALAGRKC